MNRVADAMPASAHYVDPSRALHLQDELDRHRTIRLKPGGDYSKGLTLTLRSGYEVYGLANTRLPKVVVEGGTHDAILSGVAPRGIKFQSSDRPIHRNCFERIWTSDFDEPFSIINTVATENFFLDISPNAVLIDTRTNGYVRNNLFVRLEMHGVSPALTVRGSRERPSGGNVFLWTNVLTPTGDGIIVSGQEDINFIGLDAESWNWDGRAQYPAMMNVANTRVLRVFMPHGGDNKSRSGKYFNVDAEEFQVFGMRMVGAVGTPTVILGADTLRVVNVFSDYPSVRDLGGQELRLNLFPNRKPGMMSATEELAEGMLQPAQQDAWRKMFMLTLHETRTLRLAKTLPLPVVPAGVVGADRRASQKDSSAYIQQLIERDGIAQLSAGIYYISKSIQLRRDQGIVGAGAARTAIVAMNRDVDLIVGAEGFSTPTSTRFVLADLTLIGGRNGIRHDAEGSGQGAQYNHVVLSHVTFRDMTEAGILIYGIYGWDNNLIDNVNFVDCAIGIKQRVPDWYLSPGMSGDRAGMTYLDKNVCYRCQFLGGRKGVEWIANRANNLNAFVSSIFKNANERAFEATHTDAMIFANVGFIDNAGDPQVSNDMPTGFVDSWFEAGRRGVTMLGGTALCEGCVFSSAGSANARIAREGTDIFLFNSLSLDLPLGKVRGGVIGNSLLVRDVLFGQAAVVIKDGKATVLVPGVVRPVAQLLTGGALQ